MHSDQQSSSPRQGQNFKRPPHAGPFAKLLTFVLSALFLVLAFMFSLIALAVVAVGGLMLWGWLSWKTRAIRKQMQSSSMSDPRVIEGEFVRDQHEPRDSLPLK